jgi:hypothetical protein
MIISKELYVYVRTHNDVYNDDTCYYCRVVFKIEVDKKIFAYLYVLLC